MKNQNRAIYSEIVQGFSTSKFRGQLLYFGHFKNLQLGNFEILEQELHDRVHSEGLLTEEEKINSLIKDGIWDNKKELEIKQEREFLEGRINTKKNLLLESQIKSVNDQIKESQNKIDKILFEKSQLIGYTVEKYVRRKMNEEHIKSATFKDSALNERYFNDNEFNNLSDEELEELIIKYNLKLDNLNNNLKKLAISPFFQNLFHLSRESGIYTFYGKSIVDLTLYQIDLYIFSRFFDPLINGENKPPQELLESPEKLIEWATQSKNLKEAVGEQKSDLNGTSIFGAKKEDYQKAGIYGRSIDFRSKLKEGSDELSSIELARIFNGS